MSYSKTIRCVKCDLEMSLRQFVAHRSGGGAPCTPVPCGVCGSQVFQEDATLGGGQAVCSPMCRQRVKPYRYFRDAVREVDEELAAIERAESLPLIYQRREQAG